MSTDTYLFFPGCKIDRFLPQYGRSTRAVLETLGIELDHTELNCCGYPVRSENFLASMFAAARNLSIAAAKGLPILTPCKCCYGNLKHANHWIKQDQDLRQKIEALLSAEDLTWHDDVPIGHLLTVLDDVIGAKRLRTFVKRPLNGVNVAAHYGCHALRPGNITQFDNPLTPTIFERLIEVTGASTVDWPLRLDCCGHPLWDKNNRFSLALMNNKLKDARQAGAHIMATACTYCQMQFDQVQADYGPTDETLLPAVLYSQLLGKAMGLEDSLLGLIDNRIPWIFSRR